jgi:O-antigen/teichoic acid export membrane protein
VTSLILVSFPLWEPYLGGLNRIGILPVLVMLPFMLAFEGCCHILVATGQFNARGVGIIIQSGVVLATATILLAAGYSAVEVSYSYASGWFLGMAFAIGYIVRHYGPPRAPSIALFTETFRYSVWIYLGNLIREVSLRVDFLAVYSMRSSGEAGVYSVAAALTSGLTLIMSAIQTVFFPKTSAQSDPEARESTPFYYRQTGLVMLAAGVGMAILAYPLLLMFGREFVPGMAPMLILLIGTGIKGLNAILLLHLLGRGQAYVMTLVTGVTLFVSIMLNVTLVPGMGTVGAALATLLAFSAENALLTLLYKRLANGEILALYSLRTHDVVVLRDGLISLLRRMISFSRDYLGGRSDRS